MLMLGISQLSPHCFRPSLSWLARRAKSQTSSSGQRLVVGHRLEGEFIYGGVIRRTVRPGTHPQVTWAHVNLCVQLVCERRVNIAVQWPRFTLLSLRLHHVISRGALVVSRASAQLTFLLSQHISWDVTYVSNALQTLLPVVNRNGGNAYWKSAPTDLFMTPSHQNIEIRGNAWEEIGKDFKIKRKFYVFTCMCIFISAFI